MRLLLLGSLLLTSVFADPVVRLRSGDIVRVVVHPADPHDTEPSASVIRLGSLRETLVRHGGGALSAVFRYPAFNRELNPVFNLELTDVARNSARFTAGVNFIAPPMDPMGVDRVPPRIQNVSWEKHFPKLHVRFDAPDEALAFANVYVSSLLLGGTRERRFAGGRAECGSPRPGECKIDLMLPARLPGEPQLVIQAVDTSGNQRVLSGAQNSRLRVIWPARPTRLEDYDPLTIRIRNSMQDRSTMVVQVEHSGGDGLRTLSVNGRLQVMDPRRTSNITIPLAVQRSCVSLTCSLQISLPSRIANRMFSLNIHGTGNNDRTAFVEIPTRMLNLSGFTIDTQPPQLGTVAFLQATEEELAQFQELRDGRHRE